MDWSDEYEHPLRSNQDHESFVVRQNEWLEFSTANLIGESMQKTVVAAALGECVHVAGGVNFLRLGEFAEAADDLRLTGTHFAFGGTPPVAEKARQLGFFERVFDGSQTPEEVLAYLKGQMSIQPTELDFPGSTVERIRWKSPFPLLRHHFGLPTMEDSLRGVEKISKAKVLDVISLGIDQDAQENFFHPERQDIRRKGAGGVPVRSAADYRALFTASRQGNYPLLRTYSGTDDFIRLAEMYTETIKNAWCAIPLFWFNQMDGRGPWDLEGSTREHQSVMAWYG